MCSILACIAIARRLLNAVTKQMDSQGVVIIMPVLGLELSCALLSTVASFAHIMTPPQGAVASAPRQILEEVPQLQHSIQSDSVVQQSPCRPADLKRHLLRSQLCTQANLQSPFTVNIRASSPSMMTTSLYEHKFVISADIFQACVSAW